MRFPFELRATMRGRQVTWEVSKHVIAHDYWSKIGMTIAGDSGWLMEQCKFSRGICMQTLRRRLQIAGWAAATAAELVAGDSLARQAPE
jgi:hypothetical protein